MSIVFYNDVFSKMAVVSGSQFDLIVTLGGRKEGILNKN